MTLLRAFFAVQIVVAIIYISMVYNLNGWDGIELFFDDIGRMNWPGQFNFDFLNYLALSTLWVAWRHRFKPLGLLLSVFAFCGGILFLAPYLLVLTFKGANDVRTLLLGENT